MVRVSALIISARFYPDHTEFFDENFTEARISDERWAVEYFENDAWHDAGLSNATMSHEIVNDDEIKIIRVGETNVGALKQTYKFTKGAPINIELKLENDTLLNPKIRNNMRLD